MKDLQNLRREYKGKRLIEEEIPDDPFMFFDLWFNEALQNEVEPNAMILATCDPQGIPSARTMLLKEYSKEGFIFFSNYNSKKAQDIKKNPNVCILFFWKNLFRQVRITGTIKKISREASEEYFYTRPFESQVASFFSKQSKIVENRQKYENEFEQLLNELNGKKVPFPENWGGYQVKPLQIEFWQGQPARLHDRILFIRETIDSFKWDKKRLYP